MPFTVSHASWSISEEFVKRSIIGLDNIQMDCTGQWGGPRKYLGKVQQQARRDKKYPDVLISTPIA